MPMTPPSRCPHCHSLLPSGRGVEACGCEAGEARRRYRRWGTSPWASVPGEWRRLWKKVRDGWIADHPLCAVCGCVGEEVDHIKGQEALKTIDDLLDTNAIQTLCKRCHKRKTYATRVGRKNHRN